MFIQRFFVRLLDFVFPPGEDELVVRGLTRVDAERVLRPENVEHVRALANYRDHRVRALVHEAKFHGNQRAFELLGVLFLAYLEREKPTIDVIMPIPLSRARKRARGFNQVEEVLRASGVRLRIPVLANVLVRTRDTRPQTELPRNERLANLRGAFGVADAEKIRDKRILLLDDVTTTGATLNAARAELARHSPASITCVALAH